MPDDHAATRTAATRTADRAADGRDAEGRAADHAGIDNLIDGLMPALVAKLSALNVGELEVREGDVRIRLRRPAGAGPASAGPTLGRRATDHAAGGRSHPGGDSIGAPGPAPARADGADGADGPGTEPVARATTGSMVTSPAVGVFQPGPRAASGTRVRAGDRLGAVDMLGVPQDVLAPADGIIVATLVDAGTAVEYGQQLIQLELAGPADANRPAGADANPPSAAANPPSAPSNPAAAPAPSKPAEGR